MSYETRFLIALFETVAIESLGLAVLFRFFWKAEYRKTRIWRILSAGAIASALTLPYLWFVLPAFLGRPLFIWVGEALVLIAEGLIYMRILPLGYRRAFFVSFVLNLISVLAGKFLLPLIA